MNYMAVNEKELYTFFRLYRQVAQLGTSGENSSAGRSGAAFTTCPNEAAADRVQRRFGRARTETRLLEQVFWKIDISDYNILSKDNLDRLDKQDKKFNNLLMKLLKK